MDISDSATALPQDGNPPKRRRIVQNSSHRSSNACRRCKVKKAKCEFDDGGAVGFRCRACTRADAECVFDVSADGGPGGVAYTAALEERVASLERLLRERDAELSRQNSQVVRPNAFANLIEAFQSAPNAPSNEVNNVINPSPRPNTSQRSPEKIKLESERESVTMFTLLETASRNQHEPNPELPSPDVADTLFESAYLYTQARYPLVDWAKAREWHNERHSICSGESGPNEVGAFFLWLIYAIGARLIPTTKHLSPNFYDCAITHLRAVLRLDDLKTIQGLLALIQYHCRATCGPSPWHLVGVTLRLCIEKGYHRQSDPTIHIHEREARKRAFWCTYVFDRMISTALQRPYGLDDRDIDVEEPINVDVTCTDPTILSEAWRVGGQQLTSMSFALHHLHIYRLKSRISTLSKTSPSGPSNGDISQLLGELDEWNRNVPPRTSETAIPQQSEDRTQAMYLQTALMLIRPALCRDTVDSDLLTRFANIAADACENGKEICFRAQTHTSAVQMYNSFYTGITLLQCLALKPDAIPFRRVLRAIKACSNTLAVYTSYLDIASSLAQLFDKLSDHRFSDDDSSGIRQGSYAGIMFLRKVAMSDPSEAENLLKAVPDEEDTTVSGADPFDGLLSMAEPMGASQWLNWEDPLGSFEFNDFDIS